MQIIVKYREIINKSLLMWVRGSLFIIYVLCMCGCPLYSQIIVKLLKNPLKNYDAKYSKM